MPLQLDIVRIIKTREESVNFRNLVFVFRAADVLDLDGAADLLAVCGAFIDGGALKILIDMDGLDFIDSSGIGAIISIAKRVRARKGDIALMRVPERIEQVIRPVNLMRFINTCASIDEALKFFRFS
ncbi:MAG: STAS domain-containing protein [Spirochaetes bacterium]|nr:STAS domain-containing protein [Spirochaetota bacterium]